MSEREQWERLKRWVNDLVEEGDTTLLHSLSVYLDQSYDQACIRGRRRDFHPESQKGGEEEVMECKGYTEDSIEERIEDKEE